MEKTPIDKLLDAVEESTQTSLEQILKPREEVLTYHIPGPVTYAQVANLVSGIRRDKPSTDELFYNKKKELIRTTAKKDLVYAFVGGSKRSLVLESLLDAESDYVSTSTLISISKSPNATALRKLIQGLNVAVKQKLKLKDRLIVGRQGLGYGINKKLTVIQE